MRFLIIMTSLRWLCFTSSFAYWTHDCLFGIWAAFNCAQITTVFGGEIHVRLLEPSGNHGGGGGASVFLPHGMPPVITCSMVKCGKTTLWQGDIMFHAWNSQVRAKNDTRNIQWWHFNFQSVHRGLGFSLSWLLVYQCCTEKHTPSCVIFGFFGPFAHVFAILFMEKPLTNQIIWHMGHGPPLRL